MAARTKLITHYFTANQRGVKFWWLTLKSLGKRGRRRRRDGGEGRGKEGIQKRGEG